MPRKSSLSPQQIEEIRSKVLAGDSCRDIAAAYGISPMTVSRVSKGVREPLPLSERLQLPYMPPIVSIHDNLAVIVADQTCWHVHAIRSRYNQTNAEAVKWFTHQHRHLRLQGYSHLFLWSDEKDNPALQNMIKHKTGHTTNKVYARKCSVVKVDKKTADTFYLEHHLQGSCNGNNTYGLESPAGELVACMTFAGANFCRGLDGHNLLQRFACSCSVPGGASKLLKAFRSDHPGPIVSYSDERYAPGGNLYEALGFVEHQIHKPDYRYWRDGQWHAKNAKQRRHLIAEGADPDLTEHEMAYSLGYLRCYDMGKRTWVLE